MNGIYRMDNGQPVPGFPRRQQRGRPGLRVMATAMPADRDFPPMIGQIVRRAGPSDYFSKKSEPPHVGCYIIKKAWAER